MENATMTGPSPIFNGSPSIGSYSGHGFDDAGTDGKQLRQWFTDYQFTFSTAPATFSDTALTFTATTGFKIHEIQFYAWCQTSTNTIRTINLIEFTINTGQSGQFFPPGVKTVGGSPSSAYNPFIKVAASPLYHQISHHGPVIVQQGTTFTIDFDAFASFAISDNLRIGFTITWQEL